MTRWWNVKHPTAFAQMLADAALPIAGFEQLDADALHTEDVLLKARLRRSPGRATPNARLWWLTGCWCLMATDWSLPRGRLLADAVVRSLLG